MRETEVVEFRITLSAEWYRLPCHVKIWLNDDLIEDTEIKERKSQGEKKIIEFSRELGDGDHFIKIEYLDKTDADTVIDNQHNILKDHLLNIDEIEIDEIELGFMAFKEGVFHPDRKLRPDLPETMREMICIGYNGTWKLKFEVPTYIWFLENL